MAVTDAWWTWENRLGGQLLIVCLQWREIRINSAVIDASIYEYCRRRNKLFNNFTKETQLYLMYTVNSEISAHRRIYKFDIRGQFYGINLWYHIYSITYMVPDRWCLLHGIVYMVWGRNIGWWRIIISTHPRYSVALEDQHSQALYEAYVVTSALLYVCWPSMDDFYIKIADYLPAFLHSQSRNYSCMRSYHPLWD